MINYAGILMTGARAGVWYLRELLNRARALNGDDFVLPVKTLSVPFHSINALLPKKMALASAKMLPYFQEMEILGVDKYILANITLHEAFDQVQHQISGTRILHLHDIIRNTFNKGKKKIMIVGSMYTMRGSYLPSLFDHDHIEIVDASGVMQISLDELRRKFYNGNNRQLANQVFDDLLQQYPEVDAFVIACTEHALALEEYPDKDRFISLPHLQVEYLLNSQLKTS